MFAGAPCVTGLATSRLPRERLRPTPPPRASSSAAAMLSVIPPQGTRPAERTPRKQS